MKTVEELNKRKIPIVIIDNDLSKIDREKVFTEKLDKANRMLKDANLPRIK